MVPVIVGHEVVAAHLCRVHRAHGAALADNVDAIADLEHLLHGVADEDHAHPARFQATQQVEHVASLLDAERSRRVQYPDAGDRWCSLKPDARPSLVHEDRVIVQEPANTRPWAAVRSTGRRVLWR